MVQDFIMNEKNLNEVLNKCEKFNETRENYDYAKEIAKVKKIKDDSLEKAWTNLMYSKVFYLAVGEILNVHKNYLTVEV